MKRVTVSFIVNDDTNQNAFKDWVKSCPYSQDGDQALKWENIEDPAAKEAEAKAEEERRAAALKAQQEAGKASDDSSLPPRQRNPHRQRKSP
jgi:hypothetical protein